MGQWGIRLPKDTIQMQCIECNMRDKLHGTIPLELCDLNCIWCLGSEQVLLASQAKRRWWSMLIASATVGTMAASACVVGWLLIWILALRFMMTVRGTQKQILAEFHNTLSERRAAGLTLPPAWPLIFFDALAGVFFFLSTWAHTFSCMEERYSKLFWMLDKAGVTVGVLQFDGC